MPQGVCTQRRSANARFAQAVLLQVKLSHRQPQQLRRRRRRQRGQAVARCSQITRDHCPQASGLPVLARKGLDLGGRDGQQAGAVRGQLGQRPTLGELAAYSPGLLAVTPAQVQAFARSHWQATGLRAVIAGDLAAGGDSLAALAAAPSAQVLRLPVAELDLEQDSLRKAAVR